MQYFISTLQRNHKKIRVALLTERSIKRVEPLVKSKKNAQKCFLLKKLCDRCMKREGSSKADTNNFFPLFLFSFYI